MLHSVWIFHGLPERRPGPDISELRSPISALRKESICMNLFLIANIIACAGALGGFAYGSFRFFRKRAAIYPQMITLACGVIVFGRLYQIIRIVTISDVLEHFHLGVLATVGSLLFLFAANFGAMDSLGDDGSKALRKYRVIPLAAPAVVVAVYLALFYFADQPTLTRVIAGFLSALIGAASYFNLKHLIIPDVDYGVIRCLRQYNLLALIYECLCLADIIAQSRELEIVTLLVGILTGAVLPLIILSVDRGVKKWST